MSTNTDKMLVELLDEPTFKVAGRGKWVLALPMRVMYRLWRLTVPVGFITDFASIPRIGRSIIQKDGPHRLPAVLHDYLYKKAGIIVGIYVEPNEKYPDNEPHEHEVIIDYTRKEADAAFLTFLRATKTNRVVCMTLYGFVRTFGLMAWWKHRRSRKRQEKRKNA